MTDVTLSSVLRYTETIVYVIKSTSLLDTVPEDLKTSQYGLDSVQDAAAIASISGFIAVMTGMKVFATAWLYGLWCLIRLSSATCQQLGVRLHCQHVIATITLKTENHHCQRWRRNSC